jgi:hypothetical protein
MLTSQKITEVKQAKFYSTDVNIPKITEVKQAKFYSLELGTSLRSVLLIKSQANLIV